MYLNHFRLNSKPFAMNPDPAFLYESAQHAAALTMLEYAMESEAPFCMLTGEIGSGKTTLIGRLLRMVDKQVTVGVVSNTQAGFRSIYPWVMSALFLIDDDPSDIGQFESLNDFFIREYGKGRRTLLIFDEAQNLSIRTLEQLRLLSNVNSEKDMALQIMLVGQPELRRKLEKPRLKQLAQRVAVDFHLNALTLPEAGAYVRHRLKVAGGSEAIFHRQAIAVIHERSGGIPRVMNRLCDLSLVYAFAEGIRQITSALVEEVLADQLLAKTSESVTQKSVPTEARTVEVGQTVRAQPQAHRQSHPQPELKVQPQPELKIQPQPVPLPPALSEVPARPLSEPPSGAAAQATPLPPPEPPTLIPAQATPQPESPTLAPTQVKPQPRVRSLPLFLGQPASKKEQPLPDRETVVETISQAPRKPRTLPLHIGELEPRVGDLHLKKRSVQAKRDPLLAKMGQLEPKKDRLQMKKRRSTPGWSWFFFS